MNKPPTPRVLEAQQGLNCQRFLDMVRRCPARRLVPLFQSALMLYPEYRNRQEDALIVFCDYVQGYYGRPLAKYIYRVLLPTLATAHPTQAVRGATQKAAPNASEGAKEAPDTTSATTVTRRPSIGYKRHVDEPIPRGAWTEDKTQPLAPVREKDKGCDCTQQYRTSHPAPAHMGIDIRTVQAETVGLMGDSVGASPPIAKHLTSRSLPTIFKS